MIPGTCHSGKGDITDQWLPGVGECWNGGIGGDGTVLHHYYDGGSSSTLNICQNAQKCTLKRDNFTICK